MIRGLLNKYDNTARILMLTDARQGYNAKLTTVKKFHKDIDFADHRV
jgi:hypothetical protein